MPRQRDAWQKSDRTWLFEKHRGWPWRLLTAARNPLVILLVVLAGISFATGDARAGTVMALMVILGVTVALFLAATGQWGKAAILIAWGGIVIALIDNLLYLILVGKRLRLHTVPVFFAIVGALRCSAPPAGMAGLQVRRFPAARRILSHHSSRFRDSHKIFGKKRASPRAKPTSIG